MTPTIDQIEAALPYVPAGLHCGDLTEPDERRAFAEVIHGIVVRATETAPESRESDERGSSAPTVPPNVSASPHGRNNGVSSWRARVSWNVDSVELLSPWPPPKPGTHESDLPGRTGLFTDEAGGRTVGNDYWEFCRARGWSKENAR